jgi:hypothetical protein
MLTTPRLPLRNLFSENCGRSGRCVYCPSNTQARNETRTKKLGASNTFRNGSTLSFDFSLIPLLPGQVPVWRTCYPLRSISSSAHAVPIPGSIFRSISRLFTIHTHLTPSPVVQVTARFFSLSDFFSSRLPPLTPTS